MTTIHSTDAAALCFKHCSALLELLLLPSMSFVDDVDDVDNEDDPLLTQPPSILNTVCSPSPACNTGKFFLDSIRRTIDNEHEFNNKNAEYMSPPPPPAVVIPDYVSSAIRN
jgi:hypothetical protein